MIEKAIIDALSQRLEVPVFMENPPNNDNEEYVIIERTSSRKSNFIYGAVFAFKSHARTLYNACALDEKVREAVESLIDLDEFVSVKLNTFYNFTDTSKKIYRYQAVFDIVYYD